MDLSSTASQPHYMPVVPGRVSEPKAVLQANNQVNRDTDTVALPVKTLLSQLVTGEFNSPIDEWVREGSTCCG
eukprot:722045-Prorocentrum_minimum.AAC.1